MSHFGVVYPALFVKYNLCLSNTISVQVSVIAGLERGMDGMDYEVDYGIFRNNYV